MQHYSVSPQQHDFKGRIVTLQRKIVVFGVFQKGHKCSGVFCSPLSALSSKVYRVFSEWCSGVLLLSSINTLITPLFSGWLLIALLWVASPPPLQGQAGEQLPSPQRGTVLVHHK